MPPSGVSAGRVARSRDSRWDREPLLDFVTDEEMHPLPLRRTITITGRGSEPDRMEGSLRRRQEPRRHERPGFRPDRAGLWAVLLGVLMILVAATSSHAATRTVRLAPATAHAVVVHRAGPAAARRGHRLA
jgi:hypothetical protein